MSFLRTKALHVEIYTLERLGREGFKDRLCRGFLVPAQCILGLRG